MEKEAKRMLFCGSKKLKKEKKSNKIKPNKLSMVKIKS